MRLKWGRGVLWRVNDLDSELGPKLGPKSRANWGGTWSDLMLMRQPIVARFLVAVS
jgi:hypothetical protein